MSGSLGHSFIGYNGEQVCSQDKYIDMNYLCNKFLLSALMHL